MTKADAGTYTCFAENRFGRANDSTRLVVTGGCSRGVLRGAIREKKGSQRAVPSGDGGGGTGESQREGVETQ